MPDIEPEITRAMLDAGREAVSSRWLEFIGPTGFRLWDEVLRETYLAMMEARPRLAKEKTSKEEKRTFEEFVRESRIKYPQASLRPSGAFHEGDEDRSRVGLVLHSSDPLIKKL